MFTALRFGAIGRVQQLGAARAADGVALARMLAAAAVTLDQKPPGPAVDLQLYRLRPVGIRRRQVQRGATEEVSRERPGERVDIQADANAGRIQRRATRQHHQGDRVSYHVGLQYLGLGGWIYRYHRPRIVGVDNARRHRIGRPPPCPGNPPQRIEAGRTAVAAARPGVHRPDTTDRRHVAEIEKHVGRVRRGVAGRAEIEVEQAGRDVETGTPLRVDLIPPGCLRHS